MFKPRSSAYRKKNLIIDAILLLITGGFWLFWIVFREIWKRL